MSANRPFQAALPGFLTDDVPCIPLSFDTTHGVRGIHDTNGHNPHDRSGRSNKSKAWLDMLVCLISNEHLPTTQALTALYHFKS